MCFNWVTTAKCWRDPCPFAHGQQELTEYGIEMIGDEYKGMNCRSFFDYSKPGAHCNYGDACLFRHEHRTFNKLHRRHYGMHLSKYEQLYDNIRSDSEKTEFLDTYQPDVFGRCAAFSEIHALFEPEEVDELAAPSDDLQSCNELMGSLRGSEDYGQMLEKQTCNQSANSSSLDTSKDSGSSATSSHASTADDGQSP